MPKPYLSIDRDTGYVAFPSGEICRLDAADLQRLAGYRWTIHRSATRGPYPQVIVGRRWLTAARVIAAPPERHIVLYRDGDTLNLKRSNLVVTNKSFAGQLGNKLRWERREVVGPYCRLEPELYGLL